MLCFLSNLSCHKNLTREALGAFINLVTWKSHFYLWSTGLKTLNFHHSQRLFTFFFVVGLLPKAQSTGRWFSWRATKPFYCHNTLPEPALKLLIHLTNFANFCMLNTIFIKFRCCLEAASEHTNVPLNSARIWTPFHHPHLLLRS